ncbi:hypothetical protein D210916BOD24_23890 [Alteromonas sp. D210916BOD_24]
MNSDNIHRLILLCQSMHEAGSSPSVGMLRSKAPFKVSVTEAIEAIKRFNASKPVMRSSNLTTLTTTTSRPEELSERVSMLEKEVAELKQQLAAITQRLHVQ